MKALVAFISIVLLSSCSGSRNIAPQLSALPLQKYPQAALNNDYDLLVNALKEAHTGLYWYSTPAAFDSIAHRQRGQIADSLNIFEFYNICAPLAAFTKEDHCDISLPDDIDEWLKHKGEFLPLAVVSLDNKVYLLNSPESTMVKGHQLLEVNGVKIDAVYNHIFNTFAADGFILSSKYRYLDLHGFAREYARTISQPDTFTITTLNPATSTKERHTLKACNYDALRNIVRTLSQERVIQDSDIPATLQLKPHTAILTFNTFSNSNYEEAGQDFRAFVKTAFDSIHALGISNLIIDIRENGGGTEGNEDYLFSFLAPRAYNKYKYVQASAYTYSFLEHTDYSSAEDRLELEADLRKEHFTAPDGRLLRKPGIEQPEPLQPRRFTGQVYVLTGGWTYSGGAEFASLMREHTNALFIGEETGGGFRGNTSGYVLELTLPNTGIKVDIPILKFVLDVTEKAKKGRGVLPDYPVQPTIPEYLRGYDAVMELALKLANSKKPR